MAAFKASRLVWSAMSEMTFMMAPMDCAFSPRASMPALTSRDTASTWLMAARDFPTTSRPSLA
ncbi:hypothetical protein DSECCO2_651320 [anaerobic digester metagenome]